MIYDAADEIETYEPDESMVVVVAHSTPTILAGGVPGLTHRATHIEGVYSVEVDVDTVEEEGGTTLILNDEDGSPVAMFKNWYGWHKLQTEER